METVKRYYVKYVGSGVVTLGRAGKFMPGTGAFVDEDEARAAVERSDFVVDGLGAAGSQTSAETAKTDAPQRSEPARMPELPQKPKAPRTAESSRPPGAPPQPEPPPQAAPPATAAALARNTLTWRSERTQCDTRLVRWGHAGRPVLLLAPEGGDADAIERMQLVDALRPLVDAGRVRLYSIDDVAGRAVADKQGDPGHRMWLVNQFQEYVAREVFPAIQNDGGGGAVIVAGAGLGALHAAALVCRYPDLFSHALCVSGVFKLEPFLDGAEATADLRTASPLLAVPVLGDGPLLDQLRGRFLVLAAGDEDTSESVALAGALGQKGVPHRVDPWGAAAGGRGWPAWRTMIPKYLDEWTR